MSVADELHQYTVHIGGEGEIFHPHSGIFFFWEGVVVVAPSGLWGICSSAQEFLKKSNGLYREKETMCTQRDALGGVRAAHGQAGMRGHVDA